MIMDVSWLILSFISGAKLNTEIAAIIFVSGQDKINNELKLNWLTCIEAYHITKFQ